MTMYADLSDTAVVVVGWRNEGLIRACAGNLRAQWPNIILIAVKCGGTPTPVPGATVTIPAPNLGYAGGNNLGFRAALERHAQFIVVANSDTFPQEGCLEVMRRFLLTNSAVGIVGATLHSWDKWGREEINAGTQVDWVTGKTRAVSDDAPLDFPCGALLMFRSTTLERVGGFDAGLFLFGEEIDWCERARSAGFSTAVAPAAEAIHLGSVSVARAPKASAFYGFRNSIIIRRRYGSAHGVSVTVSREVRRAFRVIAGHAYHRRFQLVWPIVLAFLHGLRSLPPVNEDPGAAVQQQMWETRDDYRVKKRSA